MGFSQKHTIEFLSHFFKSDYLKESGDEESQTLAFVIFIVLHVKIIPKLPLDWPPFSSDMMTDAMDKDSEKRDGLTRLATIPI